MSNNIPSIVPGNEDGKRSDTTHEVMLNNELEASLLFTKARQRLLDVNHWSDLDGTIAEFRLFDQKGNKVERLAELGDYFRINIPGPSNTTGEGYDWVQVEAIEHTVDDTNEVIAIRVRPTDSPLNDSADVAHFFSDVASSTFSVMRTGKTVTASVLGRNEKPNLTTGSVGNNIRNAIVATGAILGLNKPQWSGLVKGLLA